MPDSKKKKRFIILEQLKSKYRLVIMNEDTLEEKYSFVLAPKSVFVFMVSSTLFLIISVIYLIAFTSLREYIPGYADVNMRRNIAKLTLRTDSITNELRSRDIYLENLKAVLSDNINDSISIEQIKDTTRKFVRVDIKPSAEDLALRQQIEQEEKNTLRFTEQASVKSGINSFFFFVPVKGIVTNKFKSTPDHFGIDIVAQKNEAVKATLNGTVTIANWTPETGHVIQIQHNDNIISIYKHNSVLLKKVGERVNAGDPIAIIGESGEQSTGPHVHFELWYKGSPVDPQDYMSF